jgi:hypothetical protein
MDGSRSRAYGRRAFHSRIFNPIVYEQAEPVFIDSEWETWNMSPDALERALRDAKHKIQRLLFSHPQAAGQDGWQPFPSLRPPRFSLPHKQTDLFVSASYERKRTGIHCRSFSFQLDCPARSANVFLFFSAHMRRRQINPFVCLHEIILFHYG